MVQCGLGGVFARSRSASLINEHEAIDALGAKMQEECIHNWGLAGDLATSDPHRWHATALVSR